MRQNLYLATESLGCGACAIAAFDGGAVKGVLDVGGENQFAIHLAMVGREPAPAWIAPRLPGRAIAHRP